MQYEDKLRSQMIDETGRIISLATGCTNQVVGATKTFTSSVTPVAPPTGSYQYLWTVVSPSGTTTYSTSSLTYTFNQAGSFTISLQVSYICNSQTITSNTDSCSVQVTSVAILSSISISGCSSALQIGGTCSLTASCLDQNSSSISCGTLTWQSSNPSVATVNSNGVVTGITNGYTNITARNSTETVISNSIPVTVTESVQPPTSSTASTPPYGMVIGAGVVIVAGILGILMLKRK